MMWRSTAELPTRRGRRRAFRSGSSAANAVRSRPVRACGGGSPTRRCPRRQSRVSRGQERLEVFHGRSYGSQPRAEIKPRTTSGVAVPAPGPPGIPGRIAARTPARRRRRPPPARRPRRAGPWRSPSPARLRPAGRRGGPRRDCQAAPGRRADSSEGRRHWTESETKPASSKCCSTIALTKCAL